MGWNRASSVFPSVCLIHYCLTMAASAADPFRSVVPTELFSNLNNQKISFMAAVIAAKHLDVGLVMPAWRRSHADHGITFNEFWDADHLLRQAALEHVAIHALSHDNASDLCPDTFAETSFEARVETFRDGTTDTLCTSATENFYSLWRLGHDREEDKQLLQGYTCDACIHKIVLNSRLFAAARKWLRPSLQYRDRAAAVVKLVLPHNEPFVALHLRTEADFVTACGLWDKIDDLRCLLTVEEIAVQVEKHGVKQGSRLYIFPVEQKEALAPLCHDKYQCLERGDAGVHEQLQNNEGALLDFTIAMQADLFLGNLYSTMSVELVASMRAEGKRGEFLNYPCKADELCT